MHVAGANTAERNAHNGITRALQSGLRLINQLKLAMGYVGVGEHKTITVNYSSFMSFSYNSSKTSLGINPTSGRL